ncbi:MAG: DUF177 domain-containing protein [Chloroflexi bacterium]|nr:DUF177 domain-containing protein [Chloroflexota bacterium]
MRFNIGQLLKQPVGAVRHYTVDEDMSWLEPEAHCSSTLQGKISLLRVVDGILCIGDLTCQVELACGRCLEPYSQEVNFTFEEEFHEVAQALDDEDVEDPSLFLVEQNILDASEVVRQNLLLAFPTRPLCRPDCKGLCRSCGENRNLRTCDCPPEEGDPRWAALRKLREE